MTCCAPNAEAGLQRSASAVATAEEVRLASRDLGNDILQTDLSIPAAHCGVCITAIEGVLSQLEGVVSARLNLSTRRATVKWSKSSPTPPFTRVLSEAGYDANLFPYEEGNSDPEMSRLVRATAVAGFAAMNIMLLSVSVWAGADEATRNAFHVISALLALPAVAYSGRIFFLSAWSVVRSGRTNMDVPISVGIALALVLSIHDTLNNGPHAYFDAVTTLIFFLLVGRSLDHMMRRKARNAVLGLARMMPRGATVVLPDGTRTYRLQEEIEPGALVLVAAGERIPLDGTVETGTADIDAALVTGEAVPVAAKPGTAVLAGMLNLNGSLEIRVTRSQPESFVSNMIGLMEAAEHGRTRYRSLADQAAALYSPLVHSLALIAFFGWMAATGDWHHSLTIAISVLIITCPCALGLAVPMVHVVAARRLFDRGIALKDGSALERLAAVDTVVFDKTGTLTLGEMKVTGCDLDGVDLDAAIALAQRSLHPASRAVAALGVDRKPVDVEDFRELPGQGVEGTVDGNAYRLGRLEWTSQIEDRSEPTVSGTALSCNGVLTGSFRFSDTLRPQVCGAIKLLNDQNLDVEMLSGDRPEHVSQLADRLGVTRFRASLLPQDKTARLQELSRNGRSTLMVGDGLNDAPALSAAHVSMAPASAADAGRAAADLVFFSKGLMAVPESLRIASRARRLVHQNLALAIIYNVFAIPVALAGHVTPLMAAVAMSLSSILVVSNALRFPSSRSNATMETAIFPASSSQAVP